ncbi:MAG: four helix bundle protein [Candidatus Paceibacterota bacterium]
MVYRDEKIRHFTDLEAWKAAHSLALEIYKITKLFPKEELFGLTNQMRRASVSIGSNIAEGFSRNTSKDKSYFYTIAKGSTTELESQLLLVNDLGYINNNSDFTRIRSQIDQTGRLITGLIKYLQNQRL